MDPSKRTIPPENDKCSSANKRIKIEDVGEARQGPELSAGEHDTVKGPEIEEAAAAATAVDCMKDNDDRLGKKKVGGSTETPIVISDSEDGDEKGDITRRTGPRHFSQRIVYSGEALPLPCSFVGAILMKHGAASLCGGGCCGGGGGFAGDSGSVGRESTEARIKREEETKSEDVKGKAACADLEQEEHEESEDIFIDKDDDDYEEAESNEEEVSEEEETVEEDEGSESDDENFEGLGALWSEMDMAMNRLKVVKQEEPETEENLIEVKVDCEHCFTLKEDMGYVCSVCGLIGKHIESIIDVQSNKPHRNKTVCASRSASSTDKESATDIGIEIPENGFSGTGIFAHPRHMRHMKSHHVEGFNFLCRNLAVENPGGCILAQAPVSEKMFLLISFIQGFLGKYPDGRPLFVLPKAMLSIWKKEFRTWQIEDIPLLDLYSAKASKRVQQLDVLRQWTGEKSILFLGRKQFSNIISDSGENNAVKDCKEILLKVPTILVLDKGHNPKNEVKSVLRSFARVETPRKVILSGTIYQSNAKEVFNVLDTVRPKFLKSDESKTIVKRIMNLGPVPAWRTNMTFFDFVEHTLQNEENFAKKTCVVQDLREMTSKFVTYYRQEFLDELPGLVDLTVVLNPTSIQKKEIHESNKFNRKKSFKATLFVSAVSLHPVLSYFSVNKISAATDYEIDAILEKINTEDGVKTKFFLNMMNFCESANEKLLVLSQYLTPLKFLERLALKAKGWLPGKQIFMLTGGSCPEYRELSVNQFNSSPEAKIFFGSTTAFGDEISLTGSSRIIILEVNANPSAGRQAIDLACRPGQEKKVYVYRLVAAETLEEEDHWTCFKREIASKMWFDWEEYCQNLDIETVSVEDSGDLFLQSRLLKDDIKALYKRLV